MREKVETKGAPKAIGPYSQAVSMKGSEMLFCSGQIPLDPATGEIVGATPAEQTVRVMENLKAVLEAGGFRLNEVVKTTIFLADLAFFPEVNGTYESFFGEDFPARATVGVTALPRGAFVEIDAIACR